MIMRQRSSRTGTAQWKRLRKQALYQAQQAGQLNCPYCKAQLNYTTSDQANSAEVDHHQPHNHGGRDEIENLIVTCRTCNRSKGDRAAPKTFGVQRRMPVKNSRVW